MAWEFEGLFDAIPQDDREDLLSEFWKTEATSTRIGSMGYRTRTIKAGTRLEAEIYPIFGRSMETTARAAKEKITPERQQQLNTRRAKRRLVLLMETNFRIDEDIHVTLTYRDEPTEKRCRKDIRNFLNRVKRQREKRNLPDLKYIYAIGNDQHHRIHVHCVMNGGIGRDQLEKIWGKGYANATRLQEQGKGLQGMANYLYRQNERARDAGERVNYHMWSGSRNLKKPKERISDTKVSNRKVRLIAQNFRAMAKEIMEKVYPNYTLEDGRVFYSDVVDGAYIRVVMRKKEEAYVRSKRAGVQEIQPAHHRPIQEKEQKRPGTVHRAGGPAAEGIH